MLAAIRTTKFTFRCHRGAIPMILLAFYLGLSPVYEVWGIGEFELRILKAAVLAGGLGTVFVISIVREDMQLPTGLPGPLGFGVLALLSVPGMVQAARVPLAIHYAVDIVFAAGVLWCFYILARTERNINRVLVGALAVLSVFAAVHLAVAIIANPDLRGACDWEPGQLSTYGAHYAGWSVSMALFLPVAALLLPAVWKFGRVPTIALASVLACVLLGSQFVSGGRTGIVAAVVTVVTLAVMRPTRALALAVMGIVAIAAVGLFDDSCSRHLNLDRVSGLVGATDTGVSDLNALGTGRLAGYRVALRKIAERPLLGHGLGQVTVEGVHRPSVEIHSLWLKWAAYCGILAPLWFAAMIGAVCLRGLRLLRCNGQGLEGRTQAAALLLVLLGGLVASLLQPNALVGSMQYTALWWAAAGILLGRFATNQGEENCEKIQRSFR